MNVENYYVESDDGKEICVYKWVPEGPAHAVIHIVHGLAEYGARYDQTARELNPRGYLVYAHDHRGHGRTAGSPKMCGNLASRNGWDRAVQDIALLLRAERAENPGLPMILLGHSMGSFMAQQMMYQHPDLLNACALSGANGKPDLRVYFFRAMGFLERIRLGTNGKSTLLHRLSLEAANKALRPARTKFDWLSRDTVVVDRFIADPYCGWIGPTQLWIDLTHGILEPAHPSNQKRIPKDMPVYVFAGTNDPVSQGGKGLEQLIQIGRAHV
jgi:alpha-beta hydrolase superfamily lysophospholipase